MNINNRLKTIVKKRGFKLKDSDFFTDYIITIKPGRTLLNEKDTYEIPLWNSEKYGPKPTNEEIEAVDEKEFEKIDLEEKVVKKVNKLQLEILNDSELLYSGYEKGCLIYNKTKGLMMHDGTSFVEI